MRVVGRDPIPVARTDTPEFDGTDKTVKLKKYPIIMLNDETGFEEPGILFRYKTHIWGRPYYYTHKVLQSVYDQHWGWFTNKIDTLMTKKATIELQIKQLEMQQSRLKPVDI